MRYEFPIVGRIWEILPIEPAAVRLHAALVPDMVTGLRRIVAIALAALCIMLVRLVIRNFSALGGWVQHSAPNDVLLTQLVPGLLFAIVLAYFALVSWTGNWHIVGPVFED